MGIESTLQPCPSSAVAVNGADSGNRTRASTLGRSHTTTILYLHCYGGWRKPTYYHCTNPATATEDGGRSRTTDILRPHIDYSHYIK